MREYDPNFEGVHKVRITLQQWEYKGHIVYEVGGNCKGLSILNTADFETDSYTNSRAENDCNLSFDEDYETFSLELKDDEGDILEIRADGKEMNDMIVSIEILDCIE